MTSQQGLRNRQQYEMLDAGYDHVGLKYIYQIQYLRQYQCQRVCVCVFLCVFFFFWGGGGGGGLLVTE